MTSTPIFPNKRLRQLCFALCLATCTPALAQTKAPSLQVEARDLARADTIAIASDGKLIADLQEGVITLRDGLSGRTLRSWRLTTEYSGSVKLCFPRDHKILAVTNGSQLTLWDTRNGAPIEWNAETEWSNVQDKECLDGVGVLARNSWEAKAKHLLYSGLRLPDNATRLPQLSIPEQFDRRQRLIVVPSRKYVGISQYKSQSDDSKPPLTSIALLNADSGELLWQAQDLPSKIGHNETSTIAISPDGRYLAYIQQARSRGETLSTLRVAGPVAVIEPRTGKPRQIAALQGKLAQRVAFVNKGKWILVTEDDPARIHLIDVESGKLLHSIAGSYIKAYSGDATAIIVQRQGEEWSSIVDLPNLHVRARMGRLTSLLQAQAAHQGRLLLADGQRIRELAVLAQSQGLQIDTHAGDFVVDTKSGRMTYGLGDQAEDAVQGWLRFNNGQQIAWRLPQGDVSDTALFTPSGAILVMAHPRSEALKLQSLLDQEIEQLFENQKTGNAAQEFARGMTNRFYWLDEAGKATLAGENKGLPSQLRMTPDGKQIWMAIDQSLHFLDFPSLLPRQHLNTGSTISAAQYLPDGETILVQGEKNLALWKDGQRIAQYASDLINATLAAQPKGILIAEQASLLAWHPEQALQRVAPLPPDALLADNMRHHVLQSSEGAARVDRNTGHIIRYGATCPVAVLFSPDGQYVVCERSGKEAYPRRYALLEAESGKEIRSFDHYWHNQGLAFSANGSRLYFQQRQPAQRSQGIPEPLFMLTEMDIANGNLHTVFSTPESFHVHGLTTTADGHLIAVALSGLGKAGKDKAVRVYQRNDAQFTQRTHIPYLAEHVIQSIDLSPDGALLAYGDNAFLSIHRSTGERLQRIQTSFSSQIRFDATGQFVGALVLGKQDAAIFDTATGRMVQRLAIPFDARQTMQALASIDFVPKQQFALTRSGIIEPDTQTSRLHPLTAPEHGRATEIMLVEDSAIKHITQLSPELLALLREDGLITLFNPQQHRVMARIAMLHNGNWVVIAPDGRFDTSALEDLDALHWVLPEEPYRPLPLELFMRQYFEPGLLQKLVRGQDLPPLPDLSTLNRAQPSTTITRITPTADPQRVDVTVKLAQGAYQGLRNGQVVRERSGLMHMRLFRDGQLVGTLADAPNSLSPEQWTFKNIQLPAGKSGRIVDFSAYAFNVDGVKGPTHTMRYKAVHAMNTPRRAVLLNIGVNAYSLDKFDLTYAATDARKFGAALQQRLQASKHFDQVRQFDLISDTKTPQAASKHNIQKLLQGMAGRGLTPQVPALTPDDTLVIFFAGHGELDSTGEFYLLPHDIGKTLNPRKVYARSISSAELAQWLRGVDAGEIILVVDACHSGGAVGSEFKPGPMGSRGLGQLAYDKGMRILAATQADDVALEVGNLQQGILTYSLIRDGLEKTEADFRPRDGAIQMGEWLQFATAGVPRLAQQVLDAQRTGRGLTFKTRGAEDAFEGVQQPALFDFRRSKAQEIRLQ